MRSGPEPIAVGPRRDYSAGQLALIRRTVARACDDAEFDEFMAVAAQCGLDPMRRQITPLILQPDAPDRRRMIPWATIDGLRVIAARHGDYRPMETAPVVEIDGARADPDRNPLGVVRAEVRAWKRFDGAWFAVVGEAWWDEYAPLRLPKPDDASAPNGAAAVLEPSWARMGRVMIAKCAEAQALRRGWPDLLSGLYGEEELHLLRLTDQTASEVLHQRDRLRERSRGPALWLVFDPNAGLQSVGRDDVAARLRRFYAEARSTEQIEDFLNRNALSLQTYWDWECSEAMALKVLAEERLRELSYAAEPVRTGAPATETGETAEVAPANTPERKRKPRARRRAGKGRSAHEDAAPPTA